MLLVIPTAAITPAQKRLKRLAVAVVAIYCFLLAVLTVKTHDLWLDASGYEQALEKSVSDFARQNPQAGRLVFLNIPTTYNHLALYPSFANMQGCFAAPLCTPDLTKKIASLRSHIFNLDLLNKSDLAALLSQSPGTIVFGWDADKRAVFQIPPDYFTRAGSRNSKQVNLKPVGKDSGVSTYSFAADDSFCKGAFDCLEIIARLPASAGTAAGDPTMMLAWNQRPGSLNRGVLSMNDLGKGRNVLWRFDQGDGLASTLSCRLDADGKFHKYRFHLSQIASWILFGKLSGLQLIACPSEIEIQSVRFLNLDNEIPELYAAPKYWTREQDGTVVPISRNSIVLNFDVTKIAGANYVMAEISRPYEYFEYFDPSFRQESMSNQSLKKYSLESLKGEMTLWCDDFKVPGEYEVRIAAFDKDGKLLGYVSDPVTIRI